MAKKIKKPTPLEQDYKKELNRIKKFIRNAQKKGFNFADYELPQQPKKITQGSVNKLRKITPEKLYQSSTFVDPLSHQTISGAEAKRRIKGFQYAKKSKGVESYTTHYGKTKEKTLGAAKKKVPKKTQTTTTQPGLPPSDVDDVLVNLEELLRTWQPETYWSKGYARLKENNVNILERVLSGAINTLGRQQVAKNVQKFAYLVKDLAWKIVYGNSEFKWHDVSGAISSLTSIIYGRGLSIGERKEFGTFEDMLEFIDETSE